MTGGTFANNAGGSVTGMTTNNGGTVTNNGGTFAAVTNTTGTFNNTTGNAGAVSNAATGTNGGTIASLSNSAGTFGNSGTVNGASSVSGGAVTNTGTFASTLGVTGGTFANNAGGSVTGMTTNNGGSVTNAGTLAGGATNTAGLLTSTGIVNNSLVNSNLGTANISNTVLGGITNNGGAATINVTGVLNGTGTISNLGGLVNLGGNAITGYTTYSNTGTTTATGATLAVNALVNNGTFVFGGNAGTNVNTTAATSLTGTGTISTKLSLSGTGSVSTLNVGSFSSAQNFMVNVSPGAATGVFKVVSANTASSNTGSASFVSTGAMNPLINLQYFNAGQGPAPTNANVIVSSPAVAPAVAPMTSILGAISSIDASFHQPGGNLVASPQTDKPCTDLGLTLSASSQTDKNCQVVGGPWFRASGGVTTISSIGTESLNGYQLQQAVSKQRVQFSGMQTGADSGWLNLGGSGVNAHFGITGGQVWANADELLTSVTNPMSEVKFEVPFMGVYYLITKGPFSTDFTYRHSWYDMSVTNTTAMLSSAMFHGQSDNVNGSVSYTVALPKNFFVEPVANLSYTTANFDNLPVGNGLGVLGFNEVKSLLGRAGARVGTGFAYGGFNWSPFGIFLVEHEFEGNATGTFTGAGSTPFDLAVTRVGTFYQTSLGISFQSQTTGLLGFARADYRFGDALHGGGLLAGVRYTFGP